MDAQLELNEFADWTWDEFSSKRLGFKGELAQELRAQKWVHGGGGGRRTVRAGIKVLSQGLALPPPACSPLLAPPGVIG